MSDQPASLPPLATIDDEWLEDGSGDDETADPSQPMSLDALMSIRSLTKPSAATIPLVELIPYRRPVPRSIGVTEEDTGFFSASMSNCTNSIDDLHRAKVVQVEEDESDDDEDVKLILDELREDNLTTTNDDVQNSNEAKIVNNQMVKLPLERQTSTISASLEDLVNSFDDQVRSCLHDLQVDVAGLAPVQRRPHEQVIKDRVSWWTLTGNYGNTAPVDWRRPSPEDEDSGYEAPPALATPHLELDLSNDETLRALITACLEPHQPRATADAVLEEIDALMSGLLTPDDHLDDEDDGIPIIRKVHFYSFSFEKLSSLNLEQLADLAEDLESKVTNQSERLVAELARRDECEFEKETKNTFLRELLAVQNGRRAYFKEHPEGRNPAGTRVDRNGRRQRYLTTIIPFQKGALSVPVLQCLIKILRAMNDDSPAVPALLTDYILTHICPTSTRISARASSYSSRYRTGLTSALASTASAASGMFAGGLRSVARRSFGSFTNLKMASARGDRNNNSDGGMKRQLPVVV